MQIFKVTYDVPATLTAHIKAADAEDALRKVLTGTDIDPPFMCAQCMEGKTLDLQKVSNVVVIGPE